MTMCITTSTSHPCAAPCPSAGFSSGMDALAFSNYLARAEGRLLVSYRPLGLKNARATRSKRVRSVLHA